MNAEQFCDCSKHYSKIEESLEDDEMSTDTCYHCGRAILLNSTDKQRLQKDKDNNSDVVPKYKRKNFGQISLYLSESHGLVDTNKLAEEGQSVGIKKSVTKSNVHGLSLAFKDKSNR